MRQGFIFSSVIIISSLFFILTSRVETYQADQLEIKVDGEIFYQEELEKSSDVIWLIENHETDEKIILKDEEIIKYFNLDLEVEELINTDVVDEQFMNLLFSGNENIEYNLIEHNENGVRVYLSNCADKICLKAGYINLPGELIICAPHKIVIEITGEGLTDA